MGKLLRTVNRNFNKLKKDLKIMSNKEIIAWIFYTRGFADGFKECEEGLDEE